MFSKYEIQDLYDSRPNMTLSELSQITGLSIDKLKAILMEKLPSPYANPHARHRGY